MSARPWIVVAVLAWSARAAAQDVPDAVELAIERCEGTEIAPEVLFERVRVELTSDGVREVRAATEDAPDARALAVIRVRPVPCGPGATAFDVRIDDRVTSKRVERSFDLAETAPSARPRALALAIAELLRASWAELAIVDPPPDTPEPVVEAMLERVRVRGLRDARALGAPVTSSLELPPRELPPVSPAPARQPRTAVAAAFVVRAFPGGGSAPLGGRIAIDLFPVEHLDLRIDVEGATGTSLHPLGEIELGLATLGASASYVTALDEVQLSLGARCAVGAAWAIGHPYDPSTRAGSGAGPLVTVSASLELDLPIADVLALRFGIDVGAAVVGFEARVAEQPVAGLTGAQLGAWAGLAIAP